MRKPRREVLAETAVHHKMWRGHNREPVLEDPAEKMAYIEALGRTYKDDIAKLIAWYSFCLMPNHSHETNGPKGEEPIEEVVETMSSWMRNAHSQFGQGYNRRHNRQGKVAHDRPKTKPIHDFAGLIRTMIYGDCNPVRAGMVSHPSRYEYSSYNFYAYGKRNSLTKNLTPPPEYLALGRTPKERQRRYRQLCDAYMREKGYIQDRPDETVDAPTGQSEAIASVGQTTPEASSAAWDDL